jgi:2-polyprenyl-3-methyl-5-hydroxy-6-metoxy-1,4-benzoquinol methylase
LLVRWRSPSGSPPAEPFDYESIPAGYYDAAFRRCRGIQSKWHHLKFTRVARELEGHHRVLDVGCGPGTLSGHLPGHEWVGVDLSTRQIEYARRAYGCGNTRFYALRPRDLPGHERDFDALTMVELIEHLHPRVVDETIAEALARLRPGGKVVITTPNFHSAWPLVEALVSRAGHVSYAFQHINRFTRARLVDLLDRHGLERRDVEPYLFAAPFAAALGWRLADRVARAECAHVEPHAGLLLLGTGFKPQPSGGGASVDHDLASDQTARP